MLNGTFFIPCVAIEVVTATMDTRTVSFLVCQKQQNHSQ